MTNSNQIGKASKNYGGDIFKIAVIALAYFLAHQIAFFFPDSEKIIMAVWPAGGIGLAALLLTPYRLWPALVAVFYISGISADVFLAHRPFLSAVGYMTGNMVESLGCAWLIIRWVGKNVRFDRVKEVLALLTGTIFVNAISSCIGAGSGTLFHGATFSNAWVSWYVADGLGILIITPVIVCWTKVREFIPRSGNVWILESGLYIALWSIAAWQALQPGNIPHLFAFHPYMLLALLAWPALRLGQHIVTLSIILLPIIGMVAMIANKGLSVFGGYNQAERLLLIQVFMAFTAFTGFLLTAAIAESKADKQLSLDEQARLKTLADNLPNGVVHQIIRNHDGSRHLQYISASVEQLNGVSATEVLRNPQVLYNHILEEDRLIFDAAEEESAKNLSVFNVSFRVRKPDGQIRWMQISSTPRRLSDGRTLWDGIQMDITDRMKAESALREGEKKFRLTFDSSPDAITIIRMEDGLYIDINEGFTRNMGFVPKDVIGKTSLELNLWHDPADRQKLLQGLREKGNCENLEAVFKTKDGRLVTTLISARIIWLEGVAHIISITRDITDRKRAEQALLENNQIFSLFMQHSPIYSYIKEVTPTESRVLQASDNFEEMIGIPGREMIGKSMTELFPAEFAARITADDWAVASKGEVLKLDEALNGRSYTTIKFPIVQRGRTLLAGYTIDISERKKAEQALQDQRNILARVFESVPNILILVDKDGQVADINRVGVEFTGRKKERLIHHLGGEVLGCLNALNKPGCGRNENCSECPVRSRVMRTFTTSQPIYNEQGQLTVRRGGKIMTVDFLISTVPIKSQNTEQVLISITDITPLRNSERERENLQTMLTQVQKMEVVGQLAGGVAHDFNNILGAMMMRLNLLQTELSLEPEQRELVEDFETDIRRASDLTRQLLLFGRRQVMQVKTLDLNDLVENLLKMLRRLIGEDIKLVFEMDTALVSIEADSGMIEQVILNLCVNARDAMPRGGDLLIGTQIVDIDERRMQINPEARPGRYACLTVSDQGCGITGNTLQHIFEPFFTTKELGKGTGLGLSTVHGIVKQHGGWVEVDSVVDQGTVFRVYLPASTKMVYSAAVKTREPLPRGKETILLVEDEDNYRRMMVILMRKQGYTVIEAANGVEAMQLWESHQDQINLLLTDMVMPGGMTGLELSEKIRSRKPDMPVVISSGYSIDLLKRANSNFSGLIYISKPCDADKLTKTLRKALDRKI
jgi:two-component system, cell cycle sensor histidine kinase and response regulator CckA